MWTDVCGWFRIDRRIRAGRDGSDWGMVSDNGIKRIERQYRENKLNGNWWRVETQSPIRKMAKWLLRWRSLSKLNIVHSVQQMVSPEIFRVENSEWGTRFSGSILQRYEEYWRKQRTHNYRWENRGSWWVLLSWKCTGLQARIRKISESKGSSGLGKMDEDGELENKQKYSKIKGGVYESCAGQLCMVLRHGHWQGNWMTTWKVVIAECWDKWREWDGRTGSPVKRWQRDVVWKWYRINW